MDALLQQLRSLGYTVNPSCTDEQIHVLEAAIDYSLDTITVDQALAVCGFDMATPSPR